MLSFLSSIFTSKAQDKTIFPAEKFSLLEAKLVDGRPMIGSVNSAYKSYKNKKAYPWCLQIHIALDLENVKSNGLPLKTELDIANRFEDDLIKGVSKLATVHYIGHIYNDSFLDVYVYLDKPEKVNEYLQKRVNEPNIKRGFAYEMKQDADWITVTPFLK